MGLFDFLRKRNAPLPEPAFAEKRLLPRWKIAFPAKVKWQGQEDYLACEVRDLNMKGLSLSIADKIPDPNVHMELYFNEKYFFDIEAAVIWHKEGGAKQIYGLKFSKIRDSDKEKIYQMVKENFPCCLGEFL
jgi:hypothetical protein